MSIEFKMAWRNIWRNPRRTFLTISAIAFASIILVFMLSFQLGCYETMINTSVKISTGHLQIQAKGYLNDKKIHLVIKDPDKIAKFLDKIEGIDTYTFRTNAFCLVSSDKRTYGVVVTGIDPIKESRVSTIKSLIRKGGYIEENDDYTALIGEHLSNNLKVDINDEITILGQGRDGSIAAAVLTIKGIFNSGIDEFDRNIIMMGLKGFQEIFSMGKTVHEAIITADSLGEVSMIKQKIQNIFLNPKEDDLLAVPDWMEIMPGLLQGIQMDLVSGIIMYIILVIVVAFSIFNTFLMAILERTREFGVMMAIGTAPSRITKLVMFESICMTIVGIGLGIILGSLVTLYFQKHGIFIAGTEDILKEYGIPERLYPKLSLISASAGPLVVLLITFVSSVFPALKIRKLNPIKAMANV
ncbi:MAG: ABC transporter permease [Desulfobacula sp.]|uniref:ABC transporter permease n=1 Tax=Desulfobacula sp. TaxID=2593537 RepID=UPI001D6B7415|nr:ABC transporter permease [Desulfobacula sp.]MBT3485134.1 ABC transporter permease [Desulfobacula sp.]MBT3804121.1 ABC transporter permease [Desulfobacula sp.]MBT4025338.1 ABC transporter permease [Desulfobacula sp.]MBT4199508.1 ABC transporter permease [Desulfobacula sp.]